jgi:hypothetical protein
MSAQTSGSLRGFAIACVVWFVASLTLPSLPLTDVVLVLLAFSGAVWLAVIAWAVVPAIALIVALKRFARRQYRYGVAWLMVPVSLLPMYLLGTIAGDTARFWFNKSQYDRVVADATRGNCSPKDQRSWQPTIDAIDCGNPVTIVFLWGGFLSSWHGVVYDAGDEIVKPAKQRSAQWKSREIGELLSCSRADLRFGSHYYRAGGSYTSAPTDDCD